MKGIAIPREKPNIPMMGFSREPPTEFRATAPAMGRVHEKDTSTKVRAMKKIPIKPPVFSILADLLTQLLGRVISK